MRTPIRKGLDTVADTWTLHPDYRTPPVPTGGRLTPGPWRHPDGGQVMNGTYERLRPGRQVEVVAIWYGYALTRWQGPSMPRFSSPLVSAWNPVLAQGLRADPETPAPYLDDLWCDRWIAGALLYGRKPYGAFTLPAGEALRWFGKSGGTGLVYRAETLASRDRAGLIRVVAGTVETYAHLFDVDALIADYRNALPAELAEPQVEALSAHRSGSPALRYVLNEDAEASFRRAPLSVRGLTLGYPPRETAARILAEAASE
ncbi:hypothetical protein [Nonomuraea sp. NEAU-A123]|uniref:hypothetical protein n=1 Tax=Nonomuraea sp. NEAU-A123 TaxID=2839649 RepID=UPI001BE433A7|nr:hypothetical protein [Nonomuraea sp. NEAU-A123]MBT2225448.1 hypothetical protein [Nonomuraea sp. NEAU-A123]